jgi:GTP-binding protein YchF
MRLGIIGLPNSGKTTIFNALTGGSYETSAASTGQFEVNTATVNVPDERIDKLTAMYNPKKTTYTSITYADIGGLDKGIGEGALAGQFRNELAQVDGFLHVIRNFDNNMVPHPYNEINPANDLAAIDGEFLLMDLVSVEARLDRIANELRAKGKKADPSIATELPLFERLKAHLENDQPLRNLELSDDELKTIRGFGFLTLKPVLVVINMGDEAVDPETLITLDYEHAALVGIQGALEAEIAQLDAEDAEMFMEEYGITELSRSKVIRHSYQLMGIESYFTVGPDEVRAWSFPAGATAPQAAGVIHSDLEKGFIRAEVFTYDDLMTLGSENEIKNAGKHRLEGKEYIVKDGDILNIRHSS